MSDKPQFAEQYGRATQSGNLKHRERGIGDTDRLAAMALAGRDFASLLHRARVVNDAASVRQLRDRFSEYCVREATRRRWTLRKQVTIEGVLIDADMVVPPFLVRRIATLALDHWLGDVCRVCTGRKFRLVSEVMEGAPTDGRDAPSDAPCPNCNGTGLEPLRVKTKELRPLVERCVAMLHDAYVDSVVAARGKVGK